MSIPYTLTRARRKTIVLSVADDLSVQVKAPLRMPQRDIAQFVAKHQDWIARQQELTQRRQANPLTADQVESLQARARALLPQRVAHYAAIMGLSPTGVKVTSAQGRWGSCSSRNSLCFSYRVLLLPPELVDYIVVHELAHIRERNHGPGFYREIATYLPDYKARIAALKKLERELPHAKHQLDNI